MSFETFALVWPFLGINAVVGGTQLAIWLQDRAYRRRTR